MNRRWLCDECKSENNSVTWHCVICDTVSYLAPIYKETLFNPKQNNSYLERNFSQDLKNDDRNLLEGAYNKRNEDYDIFDNKSKIFFKKSYFRRTQSLTTEKSLSCRNCHMCFVNNRRDIFNLPEAFINKYKKPAERESNPGKFETRT